MYGVYLNFVYLEVYYMLFILVCCDYVIGLDSNQYLWPVGDAYSQCVNSVIGSAYLGVTDFDGLPWDALIEVILNIFNVLMPLQLLLYVLFNDFLHLFHAWKTVANDCFSLL